MVACSPRCSVGVGVRSGRVSIRRVPGWCMAGVEVRVRGLRGEGEGGAWLVCGRVSEGRARPGWAHEGSGEPRGGRAVGARVWVAPGGAYRGSALFGLPQC